MIHELDTRTCKSPGLMVPLCPQKSSCINEPSSMYVTCMYKRSDRLLQNSYNVMRSRALGSRVNLLTVSNPLCG